MSFVYFIQAESGGPIKIGRTTNVEKRLATLQIGNPDKLKVLLAIKADARLEKQIHDDLREYKYRGEWYSHHVAVLSYIEKVSTSSDFKKCPAAVVIDKLGGADAVADIAGIDVTQVRRWAYPKSRGGCGGLIPGWHWSKLLNAALERGFDLSHSDFFEVRP